MPQASSLQPPVTSASRLSSPTVSDTPVTTAGFGAAPAAVGRSHLDPTRSTYFNFTYFSSLPYNHNQKAYEKYTTHPIPGHMGVYSVPKKTRTVI